MADYILPERDRYRRCLVEAHQMILAGKEPSWFREHYYSCEDDDQDGHLDQIATRCGVAAKLLAVYVLALHLSYRIRKGRKASEIKHDLLATSSLLEDARDKLASLKDESRPKDLELKSISECHHSDRSVTGELFDPFDEILSAIEGYLQCTASLTDQADGQPLGFQFYLLSDLVQRFNPPLSISDQKAICHGLFDEVRERNGDENQGRDYDDMLRRIDRIRKTS